MKILFLAPQPFFEERGTPIAVKLAVQALAKSNHQTDLLTYHQGQDLQISNTKHIRACIPGFIKNVRPGITLKKLICDVFFSITALRLAFFGKEKYDIIHAVEESVFIALFIKLVNGTPYVYDMDSSIALQTMEKWYWLKPIGFILKLLESLAIKQARAVVPVCEALAGIAQFNSAKDIQLLRDVSLLEKPQPLNQDNNIRTAINATPNDLLLLYIGNLESYQGIDLLIESFDLAVKEVDSAKLVIIGGNAKDIAKYQDKVKRLNLANKVFLLGPRPVNQISTYLLQADILTSPRTQGNNTPMKIYSYLHSGIAILATDLPTHTQVLNSDVSALAAADKESYSKAMLKLLKENDYRKKIGANAFKLAEQNYTVEVLERDLTALYERLK